MKKKSYILKLLSVTLSCLLLLSFNIKTIEIFADNINTNISEDHLKNLQEAVLKSADRVIESELPENAMHNGLFVDLTYFYLKLYQAGIQKAKENIILILTHWNFTLNN